MGNVYVRAESKGERARGGKTHVPAGIARTRHLAEEPSNGSGILAPHAGTLTKPTNLTEGCPNTGLLYTTLYWVLMSRDCKKYHHLA